VVIEWKSYQKVNVYSRVVSKEYRVWCILALEGVNEVAEFKMAYTDPSCAAACSRFGYVRPPSPLDQRLMLPLGPEIVMSSNDGLSRTFTPGGKVETDGFTEDETTVVETTSDEEGVGVGEGVGVSKLLMTSDEDGIGELLMRSVDEGDTEMLTTSNDEGVGVGVGMGVSGLLRTSNEDDVAELPTTSDEDGVAELMADDGIRSDELGVGVGELLENSVLVATVEELSTDEGVGVWGLLVDKLLLADDDIVVLLAMGLLLKLDNDVVDTTELGIIVDELELDLDEDGAGSHLP
jgi:hypothetical protein